MVIILRLLYIVCVFLLIFVDLRIPLRFFPELIQRFNFLELMSGICINTYTQIWFRLNLELILQIVKVLVFILQMRYTVAVLAWGVEPLICFYFGGYLRILYALNKIFRDVYFIFYLLLFLHVFLVP